MSTLTRIMVRAPLVAGLFVSAACTPSWSRREPVHATTLSAIPIVATLRGAMGQIDAISTNDADVSITGTPGLTTVRLDAEDTVGRKWAMTRFSIRGGLDQPALQPGARVVYDNPVPSSGTSGPRPSATGLISSAVGCSGAQRDRYTFDAAPRRIDMSVERGSTPTALRLVFIATFVPAMRGPQTFTGSFEYEPR